MYFCCSMNKNSLTSSSQWSPKRTRKKTLSYLHYVMCFQLSHVKRLLSFKALVLTCWLVYNMGRIFLDHIGGTRLFSCANCDTILTNRAELISTRFTGATGRAFLFNKVPAYGFPRFLSLKQPCCTDSTIQLKMMITISQAAISIVVICVNTAFFWWDFLFL